MKNSKPLMLAAGTILLLLAGCTQPSDSTDSAQNTVQTGDTVSVNYRGTLQNGTEFDSSLRPGREPLEFVVGAGQMIRGFDTAVIGMKTGDEKTSTLSPAEAYGEERADLIQVVPKTELAGIPAEQLIVGTKLSAGAGLYGTITEVTQDNVTINFNHELAGKTLVFWIQVVSIEKASK